MMGEIRKYGWHLLAIDSLGTIGKIFHCLFNFLKCISFSVKSGSH